ncbi:MAG TPA: hypothetical protein VFZ43_04165 [Anaerolineales bacterium]
METNANDQKVIDLLSKLKDDNDVYPFELMELRRQKYVRQAAQIGIGIGVGEGLKNTLKGRGPGLPPAAGSWLEAALVVAIVVEAGAAAYFYRHRLGDLVETVFATPSVVATSSAREVIPPPVLASPLSATEISVEPTLTVTNTPTLISTPIPGISNTDNGVGNTNTPGSNDVDNSTGNNPAEENSPPVSTPDPKGNNGDNGNHYGQTQQPPEVTKGPQDTKVPNNEDSKTKDPKN